MPASFQTNTVPIRALFSGEHIFRMPAFQRPYSWEEDIAAQLYDDIDTAYRRKNGGRSLEDELRDYFLGPLIIAHSPDGSALDVVDGQQRLVTLSIILAILRDLATDISLRNSLQGHILSGDDAPRVRLRELDQPNFQKWIASPGGTLRLPKSSDTEPDIRLLEAARRLKADIGRAGLDYIRNLADFLLNHSFVILITADRLDDAYILFRSVNSRGQPLSEMDIARAELIGPHVHDAAEAGRLAACWDELEDEIGPYEVAKYLQTILKLVLQSDERDLKFLLREAMLDAKKAQEFHDAVVEFLNAYKGLASADLDFGPSSQQINDAVRCLQAYEEPYDQWRTPALVWLACRPNGRETAKFFQALDGLCLGLLILRQASSKVARRLDAVSEAILDRTVLTSAESPLYLTRDERADIRAILDSPISSRKRFLRPLLLRLNVELRETGSSVQHPKPITIEHVLPQKPNAAWLRLFPDATERRRLTELMGNYALLTRSLNSSQKNFEYQRKLEKMFALGTFQGFHITTNLRSYPAWTRQHLLARHERLVKLAERILFP